MTQLKSEDIIACADYDTALWRHIMAPLEDRPIPKIVALAASWDLMNGVNNYPGNRLCVWSLEFIDSKYYPHLLKNKWVKGRYNLEEWQRGEVPSIILFPREPPSLKEQLHRTNGFIATVFLRCFLVLYSIVQKVRSW